jgi:hypothetical protein
LLLSNGSYLLSNGSTATYTSGFNIDQPAEFAAKIFNLMDQAVGASPAAPKKEKKTEKPAVETIEPEVM